jgi:hypothetical protein
MQGHLQDGPHGYALPQESKMESQTKMMAVVVTMTLTLGGAAARAGELLETRLNAVAEAVRLLPTGDRKISIDRCIGAVADAKDEGAKVTSKIKVPDGFPGAKGGTATLGEVKVHCERQALPFVLEDLAGTLPRFRSIQKDLDAHGAENSWGDSTIDNNVRYCADTVAQLLNGDLAPDTVVKPSEGTAVKLGEMQAKVCGPLHDAFKKIRDQELAPLRAVLKGDKLALAEEAFPRGFYLAGGAESSDPATLAKSNVWFEVLQGSSPTCLEPYYTYRRYQFDAKTGKTVKKSEKSYCGDPGAKGYR